MAEQLALRYGNPLQYTDFDRMLAEQKPDGVIVTTILAFDVSAAADSVFDTGRQAAVGRGVSWRGQWSI